MKAALSLLFLFAAKSAATGILKDGPVEGLCDSTVKSMSGYFSADSHDHSILDKNYFYWLFESRSAPSTAPLVMWLTGGPGCSSQLALFSENGPCKVSADGLSTYNNPFSWNTNANIMWVDQPAGVGFSYGVKNTHNETGVGEDMYHFLQQFFKSHPEYAANEFYVFGESYGGHYAPAIASRIHQGNVRKEGLFINLKGVSVGNGLTDPVIQYQYYPTMAMNNSYDIKTVTDEEYTKMTERLPTCIKLAKACQFNSSVCEQAYTFCNMAETTPYYNSGLNPYDIRIPCGESSLCYDFTNIETYLNLPEVRAALHVSDKSSKWQSCNTMVDIMFMKDWMRNYQQLLVPMIEDGIRVLIYAGDVDFICNWIGNKAWTLALPWSGHAKFNAAIDVNWLHEKDGVSRKGGLVRTAKANKGEGSLSFLQVFEAGHMVPMDQPEAALSLLTDFLTNKF